MNEFTTSSGHDENYKGLSGMAIQQSMSFGRLVTARSSSHLQERGCVRGLGGGPDLLAMSWMYRVWPPKCPVGQQ